MVSNLIHYFFQPDIENEGGVRADFFAGTTLAPGEVGRDDETELAAFFHQGQALFQSVDGLSHGESVGFGSVVGVFDDRAVDQQNALVDFHRAPFIGRFARALIFDGVLQAAGGFDDIRFRTVLFQEGFGLGTVLT